MDDVLNKLDLMVRDSLFVCETYILQFGSILESLVCCLRWMIRSLYLSSLINQSHYFQHIKSKLVSEDISIAEFYLLTKRDMRELGLSVGVRRRILCYINGS